MKALILISLLPAVAFAKKFPRDLVKEYFRHSPSMLVAYPTVTDARSVEGLPPYVLKHNLAHRKIAFRQRRIFINVFPKNLPPGAYNFVLLETGDLIFGQDDFGAQIGVRHFELANGDTVLAAGEYRDGLFNLYSPSYVEIASMVDESFEDQLAKQTEAYFHAFDPGIHYTTSRLLPTIDTLPLQELRRYCQEPEFAKQHRETICSDPCRQAL